jgi:hypothetical protein
MRLCIYNVNTVIAFRRSLSIPDGNGTTAFYLDRAVPGHDGGRYAFPDFIFQLNPASARRSRLSSLLKVEGK